MGTVTTSLSSVAADPPRHRPSVAERMHTCVRRLRKTTDVLQARWQLRHCTSVGALTQAQGRVLVSNAGRIVIGDRVRFRGTHVPIELGALPGSSLRIGDGTFVNSGVSICAQEEVCIGARCAIGNYSLIMDTDFHDVDDHTKPGKCAPVLIEDDVWIGARVTILKGVRIGRGAVVAAGAVVTRDVPPATLAGGIPARVIRVLQPNDDAPLQQEVP